MEILLGQTTMPECVRMHNVVRVCMFNCVCRHTGLSQTLTRGVITRVLLCRNVVFVVV